MSLETNSQSGEAAKDSHIKEEMSSASTMDTDLEARRGEDEKVGEMHAVDADGGDGGEIVKPPSKDFPDLAPSKSMEFPDGTFPTFTICSKLTFRRTTGMVNSRWGVLMFVLFVRYATWTVVC